MTRHLNGLNRAVILLGIPTLLAGCASLSPSGPNLPAGAVVLPTPAIYRDWHQRTQACSGLAGDFSTVQFYVVPGVDAFSTEAGQKVGMWAREGRTNRIIIAGNYLAHEMVVRHEMLHALLQREGHPEGYFVERCHLTWESWNAEGAE